MNSGRGKGDRGDNFYYPSALSLKPSAHSSAYRLQPLAFSLLKNQPLPRPPLEKGRENDSEREGAKETDQIIFFSTPPCLLNLPPS
jgi:hypothetical protein